MRRVTRFFLADDLSRDRRDALISLRVELEFNARVHRGRDTYLARHAAGTCRQVIAAFCVPAVRALDLNTGTFEERGDGARSR